MEIQSKSEELMIAQMQFKRLFNNISIVQNGKKIDFRCVIGNRSRIFKNLENPEKNSMYKLPLIIIQRTGISKNMDRLTNVNNEIKHKVHSSMLNNNLLAPVPIDISYQVTIVSKYQNHIDKAIGNFIPFFNKDLYVRGFHPKFEGLEYESQVIMDDQIQEDHPDELDAGQDDVSTCTCNFTFKTYLFCGMESRRAGRNVVRKVDVVVSNDNLVSVITDTQYDGFVPTINRINVGFYPVPLLSTYSGQFEFVDSISGETYESTVEMQQPNVDRMIWKIDESGDYKWLSGDYTPITAE